MKRALFVVSVAAALATARGAAAMPVEHDPPGLCLLDLVPQVSVTPGVINIGEAATFSWHVSIPGPCPGITWTIAGPGIYDAPGTAGSVGSRVVYPDSNSPYTLTAQLGGRTRVLGSVPVMVNVPPLPIVDGRPNVGITSNDEVARFVQAIGTPNAVVRIANDVQLDLSGRDGLIIAPGVQILGGRSSRARGAKLYTRTFPRQLFQIGRFGPSDNVRISGVRIEGAEMGIAEESNPSSNGVTIASSVNVEIANNEIYGWRGSGVEVDDPGGVLNRSEIPADFRVQVRDNFIHHNQRLGSLGYGVVVSEGAYALIERNVFDYNRHAIAASGSPGIGYYAQSNLVLEHGGMNWAPLNFHTHQFDVHGTETCYFAGYYCGAAGERFMFRYNTIMYDHGTAIKVRGKPALGAVAEYNVFKHPDEWGGYVDDAALAQNAPADTAATRNLISRNNTFGVEWEDLTAPFACDFDADGTPDSFIATGATWWYYSSQGASWFYLRDSLKRMSELTVGHFNNDGYCDVKDNNGVVHLTPPGRELHGRRMQDPDNPTVYLILDGRRHPIDAVTHANLFRSTAGISVLDLSGIPHGGNIFSDAKLARSVEDPAVYLITNTRKYWITTAQAMDAFGFDWNKIVYLPRAVIDSYPRGGDLSANAAAPVSTVVPNVRGETVSAAFGVISAAGLARGTVRYYDDPTCNNVGLVTSQNPRALAVVEAGTAVNLSVGRMPRTPCP